MNSVVIPKIIHQIAPSDKSKWHPLWFGCQASVKKHFSSFEYRLWNDTTDIDSFVKENYPEFFNLYSQLQVQIMKIDFVRLCFLHKFGGIYLDMDYFVYKNFYNELTDEVGFLENTTFEYTSSEYENSVMYSLPGNRFVYELMKYVKTCFIHYRNHWGKKEELWRNDKTGMIVNNTTGSGMLSEAVKYYKQFFEIGKLNGDLFNNRPASYHTSFFGKHVHTSLWGNEYCQNQPTHFLITNNSIFLINSSDVDKIKDSNNSHEIVNVENFDFYKDYTKK